MKHAIDLMQELKSDEQEAKRLKVQKLAVKLALIVSLIIVLVAIAIERSNNQDKSEGQEQSEILFHSINTFNKDVDSKKFESSLKAIIDTDTVYRSISKFYLAKTALDEGSTAKALRLYEQIAEDESQDSTVRFYARSLWLNLKLSNYCDEEEALAYISRYKLNDLKINPYGHSAILLKSILLMNKERYSEALHELMHITTATQIPDEIVLAARNIAQLALFKKQVADGQKLLFTDLVSTSAKKAQKKAQLNEKSDNLNKESGLNSKKLQELPIKLNKSE